LRNNRRSKMGTRTARRVVLTSEGKHGAQKVVPTAGFDCHRFRDVRP
jgi:hypothetical protein